MRPASHRLLLALLALGLAFGALPDGALAAITIGAGPARGTDRAGVTWYEEFQDWSPSDLRALDEAGLGDATFSFGDGLNDSRDLVAFYSRFEGNALYLRTDFYDLAPGAPQAGLDVYVAIDCAPGGQIWFPDFLDCQTDRLWELCLAIYDDDGVTPVSDFQLYDQNFNAVAGAYLGVHFDSELDAMECGITRQSLIDAGWDGTSPVTFQVFTAKDFAETSCSGGGRSSDLTDAIVDSDRGCSDGTLNGGIASNAAAGLVYYASIAHGNQSVNQADDIAAHIYDSQANTGISGGTGFLRTLDTHEIFGVPLNIHPSGTLTVACNWAKRPGGASDPQDGPSFLARVRDFVDGNQSSRPGSLIGGVFAEHILPYFEGAVNAASLALTDSVNLAAYGVGAADAQVMHVPERVIRSQSTGLSPLDGHTFEDIAASPYTATYLDEVTHLHWWFYPGESCAPDVGYRHKVHRVNGVSFFVINDREDQAKFGNHDGGMVMDTRYSLLQKALYGSSSEIVVVFDDWEALAGKSFDPGSGNPIPNDNPNQYHRTIRWAANHPWIRVSNLRDVLALANANPGAFVVDHGDRFDLSLQTYEWLKHASEDSYHYWYYNEDAGFPGNEQSFYDLVPVITGEQGDYRARGETPAQDGPPIPSGKKHGDLNSPGTLMYDAWAALQSAPAGRLRELGIASYLTMIYETAWHEEDELNYSDSNCYGAWLDPDGTWDGVNTWALRLQNHVRWSGLYAAAARWADSVRAGMITNDVRSYAADLDLDGEDEYAVRNLRAFAVFEKYGGRCVLACAWDAFTHDGVVLVGAPFSNPSAPGEEEYAGPSANRCSAFKDMNGGAYVDAAYTAVRLAEGWSFTSPDGMIAKEIRLIGPYEPMLYASYDETVPGSLYVRFGLSPNPMDLALHGHEHLQTLVRYIGVFEPGQGYFVENTAGGSAGVIYDFGGPIVLPGVQLNPTPADAGPLHRNLALTEEVEVYSDGEFAIGLLLRGGSPYQSTGAGDALVPSRLALSGPFPSPASGDATVSLALPRAGHVRWTLVDLSGRRVSGGELGERPAGLARWTIGARDERGVALAPGVYVLRVEACGERDERRWVVLR